VLCEGRWTEEDDEEDDDEEDDDDDEEDEEEEEEEQAAADVDDKPDGLLVNFLCSAMSSTTQHNTIQSNTHNVACD
jgi:hypothetical protein